MSCPDCFSGTVHEGTPKGRVEKMFGLNTYITDPPAGTVSKGIIVYVPDVFGWEIVNSRLLADRYAINGGFTVYLPDFMNGNAVPHQAMGLLKKLFAPGIIANIKKIFYIWPVIFYIGRFFLLGGSVKSCSPRVFDFFTQLRASTSEPIGTAGFCWGGYFTFKLCQVDGLVDCGYTAHPSQLKVPDDMASCIKPISVGIGSDDMNMPVEECHKMAAALKTNEKTESEVIIYDGAKHGFATRENPEVPSENQHSQEAEAQAIAWFTRYLVKS